MLNGEQLEKICFHLLCAAGAPEDHGRIVRQHLAITTWPGTIPRVIRIIQYIRQIKRGVIIPAAKRRLSTNLRDRQVDGHYGFGRWPPDSRWSWLSTKRRPRD